LTSASKSDGSCRQCDAAPTADSVPKKQAKVRKLAKDVTLDERKVELEKRVGRREAAKNHVLMHAKFRNLPELKLT
jgi:hypothetical protein